MTSEQTRNVNYLPPKLPEPLEVENGEIIINGTKNKILKRRKAKPEKPGMVGTGLTEYLWFHYQGDDYIGFFGFFHGRFCIKFARRTKPVPRDTITYVKVIIKDKNKKFKKIGYGHSSIDRLESIRDYSLEKYDFDSQIANLKRLYSNEPIDNIEGYNLMEISKLNKDFSGKKLQDKIRDFIQTHEMEMKRRKKLERKAIRLDIPEEMTVNKVETIAGKRMEYS